GGPWPTGDVTLPQRGGRLAVLADGLWNRPRPAPKRQGRRRWGYHRRRHGPEHRKLPDSKSVPDRLFLRANADHHHPKRWSARDRPHHRGVQSVLLSLLTEPDLHKAPH